MIDAVAECAKIVGEIMPADLNHYDGVDDLFAVVTGRGVTDMYADNTPTACIDIIQVDIWQRAERPAAQADQARGRLADAGYVRARRAEDRAIINGDTWYLISCDYNYYQDY